MGVTGVFVRANTQYYGLRNVVQLDNLPTNGPTLVGYIYGGISTTSQQIIGDPTPPTNAIYAVYINRAVGGTVKWNYISNFVTGN
jgi:hypothetical protein